MVRMRPILAHLTFLTKFLRISPLNLNLSEVERLFGQPKPDMNKYELLYIVGTQYTDPEVAKIQEQVLAEIAAIGGTIVRHENLGKIRLAYPIKKARHGTYILSYFDASPDGVNALNRKLTLTDEVLRHTLTTRPNGIDKLPVEISSYVAPLSEEARKQKFDTRSDEPARPPSYQKPEEISATVAPSVVMASEPKMSIEELDKKLDELLQADVTENV